MAYKQEWTCLFLLLLHLQLVPSVLSKPGYAEPLLEELESLYDESISKDEGPNRNAVKLPHQLWPSTTLHYRIADDYTPIEAENVHEALRFFKQHTCINFVPYEESRDGGERYIYYKTSDKMCGTRVGYNRQSRGPHEVVLSPSCAARQGIVQHETLHVLGLYHEQSRPDRNDYVKIDFSNIPLQYWPQFAVVSESQATTYDVPYDYESIMHYSKNAFARNPSKPTILAKEGDTVVERDMGQVVAPSLADLTKIRLMYKCDEERF